MVPLCKRIVETSWFHNSVLIVIVANALLLGLETSEEIRDNHHTAIYVTHQLFQTLFVIEIFIRILACKTIKEFISDGWNVFDFAIVAISLLPAAGPTSTVARLVRVMRIGRLIEQLPDLRLIIQTMLRSLGSMGNVVLMLCFLLYGFGIIGYHLFHTISPKRWGSLADSTWTLFQTLTLEGWTGVQDELNDQAYWSSRIFFTAFLFMATYSVMNLFIAIVVNNLQEMKKEQQEVEDDENIHATLLDEIDNLRKKLDHFEENVRVVGKITKPKS